MKRFSSNIILLSAFLVAGCAANQTLSAKEPAQETHFWDNPDVDHVLQSVPVDDDLKFEDIPQLETGFIDVAPADRNDGISVGELGVDGGNKDMIVKLAQEIADGQHGKIDSLLIAHKGKLIFESYYLIGRLNLTHPQASATKTYTSLALGRAIQLGYLTMADLDKPLVSFLNELDPTKFVKGAERVTLHRAMTGHTGISISDEQRAEFDNNPDQVKGQRLVQAIFEKSGPITAESQGSFIYDNYATPLVMQVIEAVVPGTAEDFIKNEFLGKMGITTYGWHLGLGGLPAGGWKSSFSSRAMAKFGILAMNKGEWNGEQLIPEAYISKATSRIVPLGEDDIFFTGENVSKPGYGYFSWQADLKIGDTSYFSTSAQGGGGQYMIVIDELDLIVVATGHSNENEPLQITAERILPAFAQSGLEGPYLGQKPPGSTPEPFAPGIVNTEEWGDAGGFSLDMNEFYVIRWKHRRDAKEPEFVTFKKMDNRWHKIVVPAGTPKPFPSPDGKTLHFGKRYKERTDTGWSEMKNLGPVFEEIPIMGLTASAKGTLVFDEFTREGNGVLRYSQLVDGKREAPKPLDKTINTGTWNAHPFIAPDESYIMWDGERDSGFGDNDIYISFRRTDGSWGQAINLGDAINTEAEEGGPQVTPDGKYLFFNRVVTGDTGRQSDLYWVDAQIIENLRPKSKKSTTTASPYLGQKPPGLTPEVFAPGIVSTKGWEVNGVFTPDMKEFNFLRENEETKKHEFVVFKNRNDRWYESDASPRVGQPFFSPDGKTMHLGKRYRDRTKTGWSEIKNLGSPFEEISIMRLTSSATGTFVFDEGSRDGNGVLRYSQLVDGKREDPKPLSKEINTGTWNAHPFIAPDESYILWDAERSDGYGDADIYVSFRQQDGSWGEAINLGDKINTDAWEAGASVTPDGKYLFFNRNMGSDAYENVDIFWVDAQVIESLRPKNRNGTTTASPYLGQKPPGLIPEVFAPGFMATEDGYESGVYFSPDMREIYTVKKGGKYQEFTPVVFRYENNEWQNEAVTDVDRPAFSKDGNIIYKGNQFRDRTASGWSEFQSLGPPFEDKLIRGMSVSDEKTIFFSHFDAPDRTGAISYSRFVDGQYQPSKKLGEEMNNGSPLTSPYIAPDESYLLWDAKRDGGYGDNDLYISFRQEDDSWGEVINLGAQINTEQEEGSARVTPDGKYLTFWRGETRVREDGSRYPIGGPYWVDAQIIENLRPKK